MDLIHVANFYLVDRLALVCLVTWVLHHLVDLNAPLILNVLLHWLVSDRNVKIHARARVALKQIVTF